jgi:AraC-like DNA-binding protein
MKPLAADQLNDLVERLRAWLRITELATATIGDAGVAMGMPPSTLRYWVRQAGKSWRRLVRDERLRRLEPMLLEPGRFDSDEASRVCGFSGPCAFYAFYRKTTGETFTDWRMRQEALYETF